MCAKLNGGLIQKSVKYTSHPLLSLKMSILESVQVEMEIC